MTTLAGQPIHQQLPGLNPFDRARLEESLREYGQLEDIVVDEDGAILDGHHRAAILQALGIEPRVRVLSGLTEQEKRDYAFMVNLARRNLSGEEKAALWRQRHREITERLHADPSRSNREIAAETGSTHPTVAKVRAEEEASGNLSSTRRPHTRYEVEEAKQPEPTFPPDHKNSTVVTVIVNYPVPSEEIRTRGGLPYTKEAERKEWEAEWVMQADIPKSLMELDPFVSEFASRLYKAIRADTFLTMRTP